MKHLTLCRPAFRAISWAIFTAFVFVCTLATAAFAQHSGGHFGGAGHVGAAPTSHAQRFAASCSRATAAG